MNNYIPLETSKTYGIPLADGILRIDVCQDSLYPGIDIELIPDNAEENTDGTPVTRPRVLIEAPINEHTKEQKNLRVLVWGKADSEDYSHSIEFEDTQLTKT